eukprot:TRINITY_DN140_c0_g1_i6.p3 TRINITY_DN140_c0_g1~~TRINITY_DN140_c0_g1_i6.p3  ORF type:complete len:113 (+),score=59.90 TRINITY_DN140_c0_g1_i6:43-339(+)
MCIRDRNYAGSIEIGYLNTHTTGKIVQQYQTLYRRECHRHWFRKKCKDVPYQQARGNTPQELYNILQALRANGYNYICLLYTSPSPRDVEESRMPSSA